MIWQLVDSGGVGGIERHIATLTQSLRRRGLAAEIALLQDHGPNPWLEQLAAEGLTPRVLDGGLTGLLRGLRAARPSVLHTHGYKANILGRLAGRLTGAPVVASFHAGERPRFPVSAYLAADFWTSFIVPRIAVSAEIAERLPFRSAHIPNYVPAPSAPVTTPLPRRVGFVGRLSAEKGPDLFCELAVRAGARLDGAEQWEVFGDGPMRTALEAKYGDRVRFHGMVADMGAVWPRLGLVAMPSRFEGLPMAALEALAAGAPLLASRVGALPSVVEDGVTGWSFAAGDLDAALAGVDAWRALSPEAGLALREACWRRLRERFSEEAALERILSVYARARGGAALEPASAVG